MTETMAGIIGILIAQVVVVVTLILNGRNARLAARQAADLVNTKEERERAWLKEDRTEVANEMARKVAQQADTVASTVAAKAAALAEQVALDNARVAAASREAVESLAASMATQSRRLAEQVAEEARQAALARARLADSLADNTNQTKDVAAKLAENTSQTIDVAQKLAENTGITVEVGSKADAAFLAANNLSARIDQLTTLAGERARSLAAEGQAHQADAARITTALAPVLHHRRATDRPPTP